MSESGVAESDAAAFAERYGEATQARVIEHLAYDAENPNSIRSCLQAARENGARITPNISGTLT